MPNDARRKHTANKEGGFASVYQDGERVFPSLEAEKLHDLCCGIIEQAVYDWMTLDYGRLGYALARNGHSLIYRAEVESFFKGKWFEYLLGFALADIEPTTVRRQLHIAEPERSVPCERC